MKNNVSDTQLEIIWQSKEGLTIQAFKGPEAKIYFKQIATLRITMFKEFPYLYEGSIEDEEEYLSIYFNSPNSVILLVLDKDKVVGFSSSIPLSEEMEEIKNPFVESDLDINSIHYIGEMIIETAYRTKGMFNIMANYQEEYARSKEYLSIVFMTVIREHNHLLKPKNYRCLEILWKYLGYELLEGIKVKFSWKQVDGECPQDNQLGIWFKKLSN